MKFLLFLNTVFFGLYFVILTALTPIRFLPFYLLKLFRCKKLARRYMNYLTTSQSKLYLWGGFIKREVVGLENIPPETENLCFVANHQGYADIVAVSSTVPYLVGFVSKSELFKVPFVRTWLRGNDSIPLDRGNVKAALEAINRGAEMIKNGSHVIIFPEGTRSHCNGMREFKKGSLKLAYKSDAKIVPITLDGTYKVFEEHKMCHSFQKIRIVIHPAIDTTVLSKEEKADLNGKLWDIVNSGLRTPNTEVLPPKQHKAKKKR